MLWNHVGHCLGPGRVASLSYLCAVLVLVVVGIVVVSVYKINYIGDLVIMDLFLNLHPFVAVKLACKPLEPNIAQLCSLLVSRVEFGVLCSFIRSSNIKYILNRVIWNHSWNKCLMWRVINSKFAGVLMFSIFFKFMVQPLMIINNKWHHCLLDKSTSIAPNPMFIG